MKTNKHENENSLNCLNERRIIQLEIHLKQTDEKLDGIKEDIKDLKENVSDLSNGGFQAMLQEQNDELVQVLTLIAKQKSELEQIEIETQAKQDILDKKIKLKIWHVVAIIAGSGLISFILNFLSNRM